MSCQCRYPSKQAMLVSGTALAVAACYLYRRTAKKDADKQKHRNDSPTDYELGSPLARSLAGIPFSELNLSPNASPTSQSFAVKAFTTSFPDSKPTLIGFAPGRINLLGEHIDYMGGKVLPAAVDMGTYVVGCPSKDHRIEIVACAFKGARVSWDSTCLKTMTPASFAADATWQLYVWGLLKELEHHNVPWVPAKLIIYGDLPVGSGLSSSASITVALSTFFLKITGINMDGNAQAELCRQVEIKHLGVNIGMMDQQASVFGKAGHFFELDCNTLNKTFHKLHVEGYELVLINSMVKHALADGCYNKIRDDMENAEELINKAEKTETPLRLMSAELVEKYRSQLTVNQYNRARYIVDEFKRTADFIKSMQTKDVVTAGKIMRATHQGLSAQLLVSTPELDYIVELLDKAPEQAAGGRVMGGGFGGCVLALLKSQGLDFFINELQSAFELKFNLIPEVYKVQAGDGRRSVAL